MKITLLTIIILFILSCSTKYIEHNASDYKTKEFIEEARQRILDKDPLYQELQKPLKEFELLIKGETPEAEETQVELKDFLQRLRRNRLAKFSHETKTNLFIVSYEHIHHHKNVQPFKAVHYKVAKKSLSKEEIELLKTL